MLSPSPLPRSPFPQLRRRNIPAEEVFGDGNEELFVACRQLQIGEGVEAPVDLASGDDEAASGGGQFAASSP